VRKYFDVIGPNETSLLAKVKKFDIVVVQPKYDGSNILKYGDALYTRNLNPVPPQWESVIRVRFPEVVKSGYNFYFEFGGRLNAPAGYTECWNNDWDYRILDTYDYKYTMLDSLKQEGLKVVETIAEFTDIFSAIEFAIRELNKWRHCEGLVVKAYGVVGDDRKLKDGVLFIKVKHDNYSKWATAMSRLAKGEVAEEEPESAPDEEIRKELHKILTEMKARGIDVKRIGINEVWPQLQKELQKHGYQLDEGEKERVRQILRELKKQI